jgi:ribonuclease HI
MEISALLYAILSTPKNYNEKVNLIVYSDSEYVVKSFTENRLAKWVSNNWINTSGKVKNKDLWEKLLYELGERKYLSLEMKHIRSHQVEKEKNPVAKAYLMQDPNIIGNMVADRLADYKRHEKLKESDNLK